MKDAVSDIGRLISSRVSEWAATNRVPIVAGFIEDARAGEATASVVRLEFDEAVDEGAELVALLERVRPSLLVVEQSVLEQSEVDEILEELKERGAPADVVDHARSFRRFVGAVSSYDLRVFSREFPVSLSYAFAPEWYAELKDTGTDHDQVEAEYTSQREDWLAAERERKKWTASARSAAARRVAEDERFPQAKTEAARVFLARAVLGADAPENETIVKLIGREAKAIFDLELKPKSSK